MLAPRFVIFLKEWVEIFTSELVRSLLDMGGKAGLLLSKFINICLPAPLKLSN